MSYILAGITDDRIVLTETRTYKLWESAGRKIVEAQLTADQISQIFQTVQQDMTAAGGNRTMVGKGMDAASAVNKAWEDLKTKVQTSGPIKNVDAMYDQAAEKLKQATGGDQGVMKYVQKYRDFAKKHPIAQGLIYSALIAAAGISGAGLGGAAALGLFKMVDKLLQGEKFSSAAYSGAKTGAMAYGASKVGDLIKGKPEATPTSTGTGDSYTSYAPPTNPDGSLMTPQQIAAAKDSLRQGAGNAAYSATSDFASDPSTPKALQGIAKLLDADKPLSQEQLQGLSNFVNKFGTFQGGMTNPDGTASELMRQFTSANGMLNKALTLSGKSGGLKENKTLTIKQINLIFEEVSNYRLNEGIWDTVKGAAGKAVSGVVDYAKTKGQNLTTKITADKLMQAWKKAGSPTDSAQVSALLTQNGVAQDIVKSVFSKMKIPAGKSAVPQGGGKVAGQISQTPNAIRKREKRAAAKAGTAAAPAAAPSAAPPAAKTAEPAPVAPTSAIGKGVAQAAPNFNKATPYASVSKVTSGTKPAPSFTSNKFKIGAAQPSMYKEEVVEDGRADELTFAFQQAKNITKKIKYDRTVNEILTEIELLADRYNIDKDSFEVAEAEVKNAQRQLEAAVYGLDEIFQEEMKKSQWTDDKLSNEGQIYSTGGGASEGLRKYRIKPAGF